MQRGLAIIAATAVLVVVGLVIGVAVVSTSKNGKKMESVCLSAECSATASRLMKNMDPAIKPCDNFYKFACGGYVNSTPVPEGAIDVSPFSMLAKDVQNQLKTVLEEPSSPNEARPFKLAKNLYRTCMDTAAIEKAGLEPLRKILRQFGNWPVVEGDQWNENDFNWVESVHRCRKLGYSSDYFIGLGTTTDWKNSSKSMIGIDQPAFGLSHEYLIEGRQYSGVEAYYKYMINVAVILGADRQRARKELNESLDFELKLAAVALPAEKRRNFTLLNNPMTVAELGRRYPSVNWVDYINNLLPSNIRVSADETVNVIEPKYVSELEKLLRKTPKRVQANYVSWRIAAESVTYLTENLRKRQMEYNAELTNNVVASNDPRWKQCQTVVSDSLLSLSVSALYVRKYFNEEARKNVVNMVNDMKEQTVRTLEQAEWMDLETKTRAIEKAEAMLSHVAYPVELLDDKKLEGVYASLVQRPNDFLGNILNLKKLQVDLGLQGLRKPVNKTEWTTHEHATEVNAFYDPTENSVHIPASVLQGVFFSDDRPRYMNYGSMGFLIGHEISHSFDSEGRQFDKSGSLVDWWTPETAQKYLEKAQCIIDQYSGFTVEAADSNVDGDNTKSENIADNGGIKVAYLAYKDYVRRNGLEPGLPGLHYTPEQMFWVSAASLWCTRYRPEAAAYELTTDVHSPERFRVIGAFSNMPEFANDFNCPVGSYMNPEHKCDML